MSALGENEYFSNSITAPLQEEDSATLNNNVKLVDVLFPTDVNETDVKDTTQEKSGEDTEKNQIYSQRKDASFWERAFSPITPGSLRGSTFTLISTALGAGILSLPCMFKNTGLVLGTIFLLLAGGAALWSMYLLSKCSFRINCHRYSDAVQQLLGDKWSVFLQVVLIVYVFGALVSYFITLNQFVAGISSSFGIITPEDSKKWYDPSSDWYYMTYITIGILATLSFPISSIKNLSGLRYITVFSVFAICYIIITVVWEAPILNSRLPETSKVVYFRISWDAVTGWAVCAFAYTCHVNVFPVIAELQRPVEKRTRKIFNRCISVETVMYLSCGIAGYLSMLDDTPAIFVNRDAVVGPHDIFMTIGKLAMALNLFFVIPVNLNPCRLQLVILLKLEKKKSNAVHYGLTAALLVAAALLAMVFPNIYSAFGILGGFFATLLSYTFPAMVYLKCTRMREGHYKRSLVMLIATVLTIMGFGSATVVILKTAGVIEG